MSMFESQANEWAEIIITNQCFHKMKNRSVKSKIKKSLSFVKALVSRIKGQPMRNVWMRLLEKVNP